MILWFQFCLHFLIPPTSPRDLLLAALISLLPHICVSSPSWPTCSHAPCSSSIPSLWSFLHTIYFLFGNRMFSEFSTAHSLLLLPSQITFPAECNQLYFLPLYFFCCSSGHCLGWVSGSFPLSCGKSYPSYWKTGRLKVFWHLCLPL